MAKQLAIRMGSPVRPISLDSFFLTRPELKHRGIVTPNWETPTGVNFERLREEVRRVSEEVIAGKGGQWRNSDISVVVVEGNLLFCDAATCKMLDAHIWIETDCGTCALRRHSRAKKRKSSGLAEFRQWYELHVWPGFEQFRTVQLANAHGALVLDGAQSQADIVKAASGHMEELLTNRLSSLWHWRGRQPQRPTHRRQPFSFSRRLSVDAGRSPCNTAAASSADAVPSGDGPSGCGPSGGGGPSGGPSGSAANHSGRGRASAAAFCGRASANHSGGGVAQ